MTEGNFKMQEVQGHESLKVQYLTMVQNIISRMASYSVAVKGSCVALLSALFVFMAPGVSIPLDRLALSLILFVAASIAFCAFDAKYLQQERRYRALYADMLADDDGTYDKSMTMPEPSYCSRSHYAQCFFSWSAFGFYSVLCLIALGAFAVMWCEM